MKKIVSSIILIAALIAPTQVHPVEAETYKKILPWSIAATILSGIGTFVCYKKEQAIIKKEQAIIKKATSLNAEELCKTIKKWRNAKYILGIIATIGASTSTMCSIKAYPNSEEAQEIEHEPEQANEGQRAIQHDHNGPAVIAAFERLRQRAPHQNFYANNDFPYLMMHNANWWIFRQNQRRHREMMAEDQRWHEELMNRLRGQNQRQEQRIRDGVGL